MQKEASLLVCTLLLIALITAIPAYADDRYVSVEKRVEISSNYAVVITYYNFSNDVVSFRLNLSGVSNKPVIVYADLNGKIIPGAIQGDVAVINLGTPLRTVKVVEIYDNIFEYNMTGKRIIVRVPLTMTPVGWSGNVSVRIRFPAIDVKMRYPKVTPIGAEADFNATCGPGNTTSFEADMTLIVPLLRVYRLDREITIVSPDKAVFKDTLFIVGVGDATAHYLNLQLPRYCKVTSVYGPMGPYHLGGFIGYRVSNTSEGIRVAIALRSPPENIGDRTSVTVTYEVPLKKAGGGVSLPAYLGLGYLVTNYTIAVRVYGELQVQGATIAHRDGYTIAKLACPGPLYISGLYKPVDVAFRLVKKSKVPRWLVITIGLVAVLAVAGFLTLRKPKAKEARERLAKITEEEHAVAGDLAKIENERARMVEFIAVSWRQYAEGKLSRQILRQRIGEFKRKEEDISRRVKLLASGLPKEGDLVKSVKEIDKHMGDLKRMIRDLERLDTSFRRGLLSKGEYRRKVLEKVSEIERRLDRVYSIIEDIQVASRVL